MALLNTITLHGHTTHAFLFAKNRKKLYSKIIMPRESAPLNPLKGNYEKFGNAMERLEEEQDAVLRDVQKKQDEKEAEKIRKKIKKT